MLDRHLRYALLHERLPAMQIDDNAGRILQLLTMLVRPRRAIEIGTFFGYSAIHIARGLPQRGRLTTLEIDPHTAELARANIRDAGLQAQVEVVVGPAADFLLATAEESISMIFIDGDKRSYLEYLKLSYRILEPGGLLIADDAFVDGSYAHESGDGSGGATESATIHGYNKAVTSSPRLFSAFIGTGHGLVASYKLADPSADARSGQES